MMSNFRTSMKDQLKSKKVFEDQTLEREEVIFALKYDKRVMKMKKCYLKTNITLFRYLKMIKK